MPINLSRPLKVVRKSRGQIVPPVSDFNLYMDLAGPRSSHLDQQQYVRPWPIFVKKCGCPMLSSLQQDIWNFYLEHSS